MGSKPGDKKRRRQAVERFKGEELSLARKLSLESDRGCVLVAAAAIEEEMVRLLKAHFTAQSAPDDTSGISDWLLAARPIPPLQSFWVKASLCRVLGLVSAEVYKQLEVLRDIRNAFAHISEPVEITAAEANNFIGSAAWEVELRDAQDGLSTFWNEHLHESDSQLFSEPRLQFMTAAVMLHFYMYVCGLPIFEERFSLLTPDEEFT